MINDLDKTIERLLQIDLPQGTIEEIRFDTPDDTFAPREPAIDLFLYDVRENRDLRSNEWIVERSDDGTETTKVRSPVRVDCSYLITAWAGDIHSEHILLGEVMKALLRYPKIPEVVLQGSLAGQEPLLPTATLQPGRLQSVGEFWQALGGRPKAALNYTVTVAVQPGEPIAGGPPIMDKVLKFKQGVEVTSP